MQCPDCGGAMWDNRETKKKATQPDYKCKNKACDKAVWLKTKEENANGAANGAHASAPAGNRRALGPVYSECLDFAKKVVAHHLGQNCTSADVLAAAATLFIQAVRDGAPIRAPKAKPAPPPPPPPPPKDEEFAGFPEEVDDLPF